jgi:translocator protein
LTKGSREFNIATVILNSLAPPSPLKSQHFTIWHGVAIFVIANVCSALPAGYGGEYAFYNAFQQPWAAPPDWLFAPMWFFLNVTSLIGLGRIFNGAAGRRRSAFILSEAVAWVLFAVFSTFYFWLKSPVLGAIDTALGLVVGCISTAIAASLDRRSAFLIALRVLWLLLATFVSIWVAWNNADRFLTRAL